MSQLKNVLHTIATNSDMFIYSFEIKKKNYGFVKMTFNIDNNNLEV